MKKSKYKKQTTIKVERKVDTVIYYTILGLLIGLPLMQLIRMSIAGSGNLGLYYTFHCGYLLWLTIPVLLVCYLMIIFKYKEKIGIIDIVCYLLVLLGLLSSVTALDVKMAFIGSFDRYEGFLTNLSYVLIFLCLIRLNSKRKCLVLLNLFLCLGIFQSLYAFGQVFLRGGLFLSFVFPYMANALCGNPNFLGSYLLLTSLLSIYMGIYSNQYKKFYITSGIINSIGLVLAQSTIPFLSYVIGLGLIFIYTIIKHKTLLKRCIWILVANLLASFIMVYVSVPIVVDVHKDMIIPNYTIKDDLSQIYYFFFNDGEKPSDNPFEPPVQTETTFYAGRVYIWENTLKIVKKNIFLGIGYDNLGELFYQENNLYIDKAHNHYLNILVSNGIFSLITYLVLFTLIIIKGIRSKQLLPNLISFSIIAFMIHYFFSTSVLEVTPYFLMVCSIIFVFDKSQDDMDLVIVKE